jgi:hypothetical protein
LGHGSLMATPGGTAGRVSAGTGWPCSLCGNAGGGELQPTSASTIAQVNATKPSCTWRLRGIWRICMGLILLEALGALLLLVLIVWWTMFAGRNKGELPSSDAAHRAIETERDDKPNRKP